MKLVMGYLCRFGFETELRTINITLAASGLPSQLCQIKCLKKNSRMHTMALVTETSVVNKR